MRTGPREGGSPIAKIGATKYELPSKIIPSPERHLKDRI